MMHSRAHPERTSCLTTQLNSVYYVNSFTPISQLVMFDNESSCAVEDQLDEEDSDVDVIGESSCCSALKQTTTQSNTQSSQENAIHNHNNHIETSPGVKYVKEQLDLVIELFK